MRAALSLCVGSVALGAADYSSAPRLHAARAVDAVRTEMPASTALSMYEGVVAARRMPAIMQAEPPELPPMMPPIQPPFVPPSLPPDAPLPAAPPDLQPLLARAPALPPLSPPPHTDAVGTALLVISIIALGLIGACGGLLIVCTSALVCSRRSDADDLSKTPHMVKLGRLSSGSQHCQQLPAGVADGLPTPWSAAVDGEGNVYFWNMESGETQWTRPIPTPAPPPQPKPLLPKCTSTPARMPGSIQRYSEAKIAVAQIAPMAELEELPTQRDAVRVHVGAEPALARAEHSREQLMIAHELSSTAPYILSRV